MTSDLKGVVMKTSVPDVDKVSTHVISFIVNLRGVWTRIFDHFRGGEGRRRGSKKVVPRGL